MGIAHPWRQLEVQGWEQHARGKRNHEQVVDEGPGVVVVDAAEGGL